MAINKTKSGKSTRVKKEIIFCANYLKHVLHLAKYHLWLKSIINPIPKSQSDDLRVPINYSGISLMNKIYISLYLMWGSSCI